MCRNIERLYTNFNIIVRYNKPITAKQLGQALQLVIDKNPVLTLNCFQTDDRKPSEANYHNFIVRPIENIKFLDVVEFVNDSFDEAFLERVTEVSFPVNCHRPLWKFMVIQQPDGNQYICGIFDHIFYDGNSGMYLHKQLEQALSDNDKEIYLKEETSSTGFDLDHDLFIYDQSFGPMLAPITKQIPFFAPTFLTLVKYYTGPIFGLFRPLLTFLSQLFKPISKPSYYHIGINKEMGDIKTRFKIAKFTPNEVSIMTKYCKVNGLKLTLYLHILALKSLQTTVNPRTHPGQKIGTRSLCPINGRRYANSTNFIHGSALGRYLAELPYLKGPLVKYMKNLYANLQKEITSGNDIKNSRILEYIDILDGFKKKVTAHSGRTIVVTNLGKFPKLTGPYQVQEIYFSGNIGYMHTFNFSCVTGESGLTVTLGYLPDFDEYGKDMMELAIKEFHDSAIEEAIENKV